jgi:hypothetical protein
MMPSGVCLSSLTLSLVVARRFGIHGRPCTSAWGISAQVGVIEPPGRVLSRGHGLLSRAVDPWLYAPWSKRNEQQTAGDGIRANRTCMLGTARYPVLAMDSSHLATISKLGKPHVREEVRLRIKRRLFELPVFVSHTSTYTNVYHCCIGRSGSQWMKRVLSDPRVFRRSGLRVYTYQDRLPGRVDTRRLTERTFETPFPQRRIVTPLYLSFDNFQQLPKPSAYRAFFISRDPRDMVVSAYFLRRNTDTLGNTSEDRDYLQSVPLERGLLYIIDRAEWRGVFDAFRSWSSSSNNENVRLIRLEDMAGENGFFHMQALFSFCDFSLDRETLEQLLRDCSFDRLSGGRTRGRLDRSSHYRKGVSGDWRNHFTPRVRDRFNEVAGDLLDLYGYE